jgi:pimeloyl-ACP methyl ester carboxylesterase
VVGAGPPAVLWHSLCVDRTVWSRVRNDLAAHRQLVLLDAPGHGQSDTPRRRFTLDDGADVAVAVLDALDIDEPVDWVGNAWGGHLGIALGARDPRRLRTLTTIATSVRAVTGSLRSQIHLLLAAHRLLGARPFVVDRMLPTFLSPSTRSNDPEAVAYLRGRIANLDRQGFHTTMASVMLDRQDLSEHVNRLRMPTLFITGADDALWTPADVHAAESTIAPLRPRATRCHGNRNPQPLGLAARFQDRSPGHASPSLLACPDDLPRSRS